MNTNIPASIVDHERWRAGDGECLRGQSVSGAAKASRREAAQSDDQGNDQQSDHKRFCQAALSAPGLLAGTKLFPLGLPRGTAVWWLGRAFLGFSIAIPF